MESFSAIQDEAKISVGSDEDDSEDMENGLSSFASFNQNPKPMLKPAIIKRVGGASRKQAYSKKTINIQQSHLLKMIADEAKIQDSDKNLEEIPR